MTTFDLLHEGWTLRAIAGTPPAEAPALVANGEPVPATVPGCVHTDLLAAGLIADPFLDDNERGLGWIGRTDWEYRTTFDVAGFGEARAAGVADPGRIGCADRFDLVSEGLDTVATVEVNGVEVGSTENMHRGYRFDVTDVLRGTGNELVVRFGSPYRYAEAIRDSLGERPGAYPEPYQYIRKMACNFGWDWGPTLVTSGIWQPIGLHRWSTARLSVVRPQVSLLDGGATGLVEVEIGIEAAVGRAGVTAVAQRAGVGVEPARGGVDRELTVEVEVAGVTASATVAAGSDRVTLAVEVPNPRLWWPVGHGEQPLYQLSVVLRDGAARLDGWRRRIGFRSVHLDTSADADGSAFVLVVNDKPIFVRGVNWIPDDAFPTRVDRQRYAHRMAQAVEANVNLLRVWGGGRYESDDFYDLADELGLLVFQDFLFACAAYPEEDPIGREVAAEAEDNVLRLICHPSLVVWHGNNENLWGYRDWGWPEALGGRSWGLGYYLDLLPSIMARLDPSRPYWPGSPYSGDPDRHPNDPSHGTTHIWDVWNTDDWRHYATYRPRFVAEFGFQAPPAYATMRRAVSDDPLLPDGPGPTHHQKAIDGNAKLLRGLDGHLPRPVGFDDWHYATQVNQARAISFGIEHFRALAPLCAGVVLWQLNDCWPVTSWSAVDAGGRRKPLWYALRRVFAERLLSVQPCDGGTALVAVNDTGSALTESVEVRRCCLRGRTLAATTVDVDVPAGGVGWYPLPVEVATADQPALELIVAGAGPERAVLFFAEDVDREVPPGERHSAPATDHLSGPVVRSAARRVSGPAADLMAEVVAVACGYQVTVTAASLLRDLCLFADRLAADAQVDQAMVTLLPGESVTFTVRTAEALDPAALTSAPVLRHVGQLIGGGPGPGLL